MNPLFNNKKAKRSHNWILQIESESNDSPCSVHRFPDLDHRFIYDSQLFPIHATIVSMTQLIVLNCTIRIMNHTILTSMLTAIFVAACPKEGRWLCWHFEYRALMPMIVVKQKTRRKGRIVISGFVEFMVDWNLFREE